MSSNFQLCCWQLNITTRWEVETTIDELKVHLNGRKTPIRSQNPREVVQFVYGWLLSHWAVRCLMFQVAQQAQISPLRLGFTGTLKVKRLSCAQISEAPARGVPFFSRVAKLAGEVSAPKTPNT